MIRARLDEPKPLPIPTMLAAIDTEGREAVNRARERGVPAVRSVLPARSGRLRRGTTGRVSRTGTGFQLTIAPSGRVRYPSGVTAREVFRFVDKGTGVFGSTGRPIRPRTARVFALPGGFETAQVQGQRAQGIAERGRDAADAIVLRELEHGADLAARRAEGVLG